MWKLFLLLKTAFVVPMPSNNFFIEDKFSSLRDVDETTHARPNLLSFHTHDRTRRSVLYSTVVPAASTVEEKQNMDAQVSRDDDEDSLTARSEFGLKRYWDDVYAGRGSFPAAEYSWYYDYNHIRPHLNPFLPKLGKINVKNAVSTPNGCHIYIPGIGNDPIIIDLVASGSFTQITAHDYSKLAIQRQREILAEVSNSKTKQIDIQLGVCNVVQETPGLEVFDIVLEKGLLDAIYLSDDSCEENHPRLENAVQNLIASLKPHGILVSVSGVVPHNLRQTLFAKNMECLRDGANDLQAGCFLYRKLSE